MPTCEACSHISNTKAPARKKAEAYFFYSDEGFTGNRLSGAAVFQLLLPVQ